MADQRVLCVFTLNCLHTGHWVRVDHYIVMDWAHVLVIVQCQTDGCSPSCKDGAIVRQSFGKLAAGCLTILEMAVDDHHCPHSLIHFGAISVDFIMRSLRFMILTELSLGFLSADHAFAYSLNAHTDQLVTFASSHIPHVNSLLCKLKGIVLYFEYIVKDYLLYLS